MRGGLADWCGVRNKALYKAVVMKRGFGKGRQNYGHEREPVTSTGTVL